MKTLFRTSGVALAIVVTSAAGMCDAGTLNDSIRRASAQIFIQDQASFSPPFTPRLNLLDTDTAPGTEDYLAESGAGTNQPNGLGYYGVVASRLESGFDPGDPGLGGPFRGYDVADALVYSEVITQSDDALFSQTLAATRSFITFTLTETMSWSWSALVSGFTEGMGENEYAFGIYDYAIDDFAELQILTDTFDQRVSLSGLLGPGQYQLSVALSARNILEFTTGSGTAQVTLTDGRFRLTAIPEPSTMTLVLPAMVALFLLRRRLLPPSTA
ncbi:hypothetical protein [Tautonia rosea]|uniref:hypothetical protein n=1 Tax=Tautonia rosea TaxID=2728037 RepID=UPI0014737564|nr:hypothetical protein [Tautonia rosea]